MNEERRRILGMLAENKITAEQAESLLDAMSRGSSVSSASSSSPSGERAPVVNPKYLRVLVEGHEDGHANRVNMRVPIN